jgi:hypothetical protein
MEMDFIILTRLMKLTYENKVNQSTDVLPQTFWQSIYSRLSNTTSNLDQLSSDFSKVKIDEINKLFRHRDSFDSPHLFEHNVIVKSKQRQICFQAEVHKTKKPWHLMLLIMNCLLPGSGTALNSCYCLHSVNEKTKVETQANILLGLCQFLLSFLVVGWIHSVLWGIKIYRSA